MRVFLLRFVAVTMATVGIWASSAAAQPPANPAAPPATGDRSRIVIGTLANDSNPDDLDFQGGECLVDTSGRTMACAFQQVFLTIAPFDAQVCLVTTNSFERRFEKQSETTWVSRDADGACTIDTATLTDDGGEVRWTLEYRKTNNGTDPACRGGHDLPPERYSWRHARRALACRFVQPGAIR